MLTDAILFVLGAGVTLAFWDVAKSAIAARRFNQRALDRLAALETASGQHDEHLKNLHSKLGAQQAAQNNQRALRGLGR